MKIKYHLLFMLLFSLNSCAMYTRSDTRLDRSILQHGDTIAIWGWPTHNYCRHCGDYRFVIYDKQNTQIAKELQGELAKLFPENKFIVIKKDQLKFIKRDGKSYIDFIQTTKPFNTKFVIEISATRNYYGYYRGSDFWWNIENGLIATMKTIRDDNVVWSKQCENKLFKITAVDGGDEYQEQYVAKVVRLHTKCLIADLEKQ